MRKRMNLKKRFALLFAMAMLVNVIPPVDVWGSATVMTKEEYGGRGGKAEGNNYIICMTKTGDHYLDFNEIDTNNDGKVDSKEAKKVENVWLCGEQAKKYKYFKNAVEIKIRYGKMEQLDFSKNLKLTDLWIDYCSKLK